MFVLGYMILASLCLAICAAGAKVPNRKNPVSGRRKP
jgi:hypothetical protein